MLHDRLFQCGAFSTDNKFKYMHLNIERIHNFEALLISRVSVLMDNKLAIPFKIIL